MNNDDLKGMVPGRWWRVDLPDGTLWAETSDMEEALRLLEERPELTLYRMWVPDPSLSVWVKEDVN